MGEINFGNCSDKNHAISKTKAMDEMKINLSFINVPIGKTKLDTIERLAIKNKILNEIILFFLNFSMAITPITM